MANDISFDVHIEGDVVLIKDFEAMEKKAGNLRPAFQKIADLLYKSHMANFKNQGTRFGSRWATRARSYAWPIMYKTHRLYNSYGASYSSNEARITNTASYAKYHQSGTRKMPQRNLVGWSDSKGSNDINDAIRILRKHIGV